MSLLLRAGCASMFLGAGGCTWNGEAVRWTPPDPPRRVYYPAESERIDEDLRRLEDDKPLKYHDDEKELRRHAFERDFYNYLYNH